MKKLLTLTIIAIIALIGLSVSVNAADVNTEPNLKAAVLVDGTITLSADIELTSSLEVGKKVTINLNGYNITAADGMTDDSLIIVLHGGELTVEGNGSISATNSNASARVAVKMTKAGNTADFINNNPAKFILNSGALEGTSFGISGNGNPDRVNTYITINGGTVKGESTGIYHPQEGTLTINGGTVKGLTGIEMRSGNLQVNSGTIIGTGVPASSESNLSGSTTLGAGIAVAQHTTEKNINVIVEGGNIQGYSALYESNPQSNDTMEKVCIEIKGGKFEAINGGQEAVYSEDKTGFITGGSFSSAVDDYMADGEYNWTYDDEGNMVVFVPVQLDKPTNVKWDGTKATWNAVPNADGYGIMLYNGEWSTQPIWVEVENTSYDFGKYLTDKDAKYVFEVWAEGNGNPYYMSETVTSDEYVFPTEESKVEEDDSTEGGEGTTVQQPEADKKEEPKVEEKDETPKTGSVNVVLFVNAIVAVISVAGIVTVKKYTR